MKRVFCCTANPTGYTGLEGLQQESRIDDMMNAAEGPCQNVMGPSSKSHMWMEQIN